jgi:hypothetical protein
MRVGDRVAHAVAAFTTLLICLWASACSRDDRQHAVLREHASSFIPDDAADKVTSSGLPWVQISFTVRRPPLEFAIDEARLDDAASKGWSLCRPGTAEWEGYADATVTPERYTQHRAYVLHKDGILITLTGFYHSSSEQTAVAKRPESNEMPIQQVYVIVRRATAEEALEVAAAQRLSCGGKP